MPQARTCSPSRLRTRLSATYACPSAKQSLRLTRARSRVRPCGTGVARRGGKVCKARLTRLSRPGEQPNAPKRAAHSAARPAHAVARPAPTHYTSPTCDLCTVMAQASLRGIWVRVQEPTPARSALNTVGPAQQAQQGGCSHDGPPGAAVGVQAGAACRLPFLLGAVSVHAAWGGGLEGYSTHPWVPPGRAGSARQGCKNRGRPTCRQEEAAGRHAMCGCPWEGQLLVGSRCRAGGDPVPSRAHAPALGCLNHAV